MIVTDEGEYGKFVEWGKARKGTASKRSGAYSSRARGI